MATIGLKRVRIEIYAEDRLEPFVLDLREGTDVHFNAYSMDTPVGEVLSSLYDLRKEFEHTGEKRFTLDWTDLKQRAKFRQLGGG